MSIVGEICEKAISAGSLSGTSGIPFVEACRLYLAHCDIPEHEQPSFYCRLSEALFHRGRREDAIESARIAFDLQPRTEAITSLCAWVFSNCGRHEEAAAAYERLLEIRCHWAEGHRHASGSFAVVGRVDRAIFHGGRASDLDPNSFEFAFHAACLLEAAGRYQDAIGYFTRAAAVEPNDSSVLRRISAAKLALGEKGEAVAFALRAVSIAPRDLLNARHATELLLRTERFDDAAQIILAAVDTHSQDDVAFRLLSATQILRGRTADALDAIDRALAIAPDMAEYHSHRGNLLYHLGRLDESAEAFGRATELDPSNPDAKRSQLTVYFDSGRFTEALAVGGELIRTSPENEEYAQAVLQVLNRRFETLDGDYVVLSERALRQPRNRPPFSRHCEPSAASSTL